MGTRTPPRDVHGPFSLLPHTLCKMLLSSGKMLVERQVLHAGVWGGFSAFGQWPFAYAVPPILQNVLSQGKRR